ncbi:MAG: RagB/SusD family nutrient uptake outer membrane protein [Pedobacter sp.]|nr:MAG: RagB/SusD family nutrient uptake outer membrane protein [Pedobacter sp.]
MMMTMKIKFKHMLFAIVLAGTFSGCKKDFLEAKPSTQIVIPTTLEDFQNLLDYDVVINRTSSLGLLSCDDYYIPTERDLLALTPTQQNGYVWSKDLFGGETNRVDWSMPYKSILYANSVLEGLDKIASDKGGNIVRYNSIKGQALFARAYAHFDLAKNFAPAYDPKTAGALMGVPLKLSASVDEIVPRASLEDTYKQIIADLSTAVSLLDGQFPIVNRNRSSKVAAHALFARLYHSMREYTKAEKHADSALLLYNKLLDYNTISTTATNPFTRTNDDVIMQSSIVQSEYNVIWANSAVNLSVDSILYSSYDSNDLRRSIFFTNNTATKLIKPKRGYSANTYAFSGLASDELYLIKAECLARKNESIQALNMLNNLLVKRFKTGTYRPFTISNTVSPLTTILLERRKELIWRGDSRWDDIKRLNMEGASISLTRKIGGKEFTLTPNSPKYTFPIPDDEIALGGITQNNR